MKVKERQKLNKQIAKRVGAYGMIKRNEFLGLLSDTQRDELDLLTVCDDRTPAQEERLAKLWDKARRRHDEKKERQAKDETDAKKAGMSYQAYIAWMRLTHNGRRGRAQMSPADQAEYDFYEFKREPPMSAADQAEAKRLYEEATTDPETPSAASS